MNREIKFRGLRTDGKGLVYGGVVITPNESYIIVPGKNKYTKNYYTTQVEVLPETVGQFTGLYDKNGTEIYEGDEFKDVRSHGDYSDDTFLVTFKDGKFGFYNYGIFDDRFDCESIEVIGNTTEHKDLLP